MIKKYLRQTCIQAVLFQDELDPICELSQMLFCDIGLCHNNPAETILKIYQNGFKSGATHFVKPNNYVCIDAENNISIVTPGNFIDTAVLL